MRNTQTARLAIFGFILILTASVKMFAAGDLDATFTAGVASLGSTASVVVVQSDGRVLVGGNFRVAGGRSSPGLVRLNADGTIDQSFNIGTGVNFGAYVNAIAVQTDGKILVGGGFVEFNGVSRYLLVRLNSDGSLDANFNSGITNGFSVNAVALQPDGKILVGGSFYEYNGTATNNFARLNSNGSLDATFATNLGTGFDFTVNAIAVEPDGQIVVGGIFLNVNGTTASLIARLNGSGTLDTAFTASGGTGFPAYTVNKILLQANGQILVGGRFFEFNGVTRTDLLRLNADGSLDMNFAPASNSTVLDLLIQPDGQIIAAGGGAFGTMQERTFIARLNQADGSLDSTFDAGTTYQNTSGNTINSIAFQLDGSIFAVGGFGTFSGVVRSNLAKINQNGGLNQAFTTVIGFPGQVYDLLVLPDNKILIGGDFRGVNESFRDAIARLNADGTTDTTFNSGQITGGFGIVYAIAVQSNGKVIIGGNFYAGATNNFGIARLNADGSLDATFNASVNGSVNAVAVQPPDGKILIGGSFTNVNGINGVNGITRLNADGTTDTSFNNGGAGFNFNVDDLILQPNGQILVGGGFTEYNGAVGVNRIARLNSNGTRDATFTTNTGAGFDSAVYTLALQPDGKILAGGGFINFNGTNLNGIARLNANGTLDNTFNIGTGFNNSPQDLALQTDGRIVAVGYFTQYNGVTRYQLARLNADGSLDTSFSSGVPVNNSLLAVGIQCDGRILIGGGLQSYDNIPRLGIARVTAGDTVTWTGAVDTNWNTGANWSTGFVPTVTDIAVIPNNFTVNLSGGNFNVLSLTVGTNSTLTIAAASSLTIEGGTNNGTISGAGILNIIGTALTNNGTISVSAVNVNLNTNCAGFSPTQSKALIGGGAFVSNVLTVASGVTLSLQGNHQFNQINLQGTLNATSRTISLRGANPLQGAGGIITTFSTIIYDGSTAQTIANINYNNLTLNNAAGANLSGNTTVGGALNLQTGTLAVGANTLTLNGAFGSPGGNFTSATTGTVNYNQGSNGQAILAGSYGNLTFSNFNKTLTGAAINIAGTFTPGNAAGHTTTGGTFNFNGAAAQTIPAFNYHNLTFNNVNKTLANTGTIRIAGTFTPGGGTAATTGSTISFSGTAAQTIPVFNYNNLTLNNTAGASLSGGIMVGGALTLTAGTLAVGTNTLTLNGAATKTGGSFSSATTGTVIYNQGSNGQAILAGNYGNLTFSNFNKNLTNAAIGIAGAFAPGNATGHTTTGSTFNFNGAAQTIPAFTFNHLSTSGSGTKTLGGALSVSGNLTTGSGTTLDVSASNFALNVAGNFTANGIFTPQAGTVILGGAAAQTVGGASATNFNNLTISNAAGITLNGNSTVANLTLSSGNLLLGANTLTVTGIITRTSGHVVGSVRKNLAAGNSFTFAIGTANGYSPVTVNLTGGAIQVTASVAQINQPTLDPAKSLKRYWTLTASGGAFTANLTFNYLDPTDISGNENAYRITRVTGGVPLHFPNNCANVSPCVNTGANTAFISGVTEFSDWTLSEAAPSAASVLISGRVTAFTGRGISNARISITNANGETRYAMTNPFGYYRFADVAAGETYIVSVSHKRYRFVNNPLVRFVGEDAEDFNFVTLP